MCMSLLKLAHLQKIEVKLKRYKLIWNTAQDFANSGVIREGGMGAYSHECRLGASTHTLSFKNKF